MDLNKTNLSSCNFVGMDVQNGTNLEETIVLKHGTQQAGNELLNTF